MEVFREFTFDSAHLLPNAPDGHKCRRLHGHTYQVSVHVAGPVDPERGWILDFADIEAAFDPIYEALDHRFLNDIAGLSNPTSEHLAAWIWERLAPGLPGLARVVVKETCTSGCTYAGPASDPAAREAGPNA
jgi:6-pyruvoyltetrahydropterin/6-carboxytetrahydropterin synthase